MDNSRNAFVACSLDAVVELSLVVCCSIRKSRNPTTFFRIRSVVRSSLFVIPSPICIAAHFTYERMIGN